MAVVAPLRRQVRSKVLARSYPGSSLTSLVLTASFSGYPVSEFSAGSKRSSEFDDEAEFAVSLDWE